MIVVDNQIDDSWSDYSTRSLDHIQHIMIHRSGPWPDSYGDPGDAYELIQIFKDPNLGTGGKMPYTFVYNPNTLSIFKALPEICITPHARSWNTKALSIAILRDLRNQHLNTEEYIHLVRFCTHLKRKYPRATIVGHTDLPNSSGDPNKECPGNNLDCTDLDDDTEFAILLGA